MTVRAPAPIVVLVVVVGVALGACGPTTVSPARSASPKTASPPARSAAMPSAVRAAREREQAGHRSESDDLLLWRWSAGNDPRLDAAVVAAVRFRWECQPEIEAEGTRIVMVDALLGEVTVRVPTGTLTAHTRSEILGCFTDRSIVVLEEGSAPRAL